MTDIDERLNQTIATNLRRAYPASPDPTDAAQFACLLQRLERAVSDGTQARTDCGPARPS